MLILILLEITNQGLTSQWVKIFLLPQEEDQLGNQKVNKKHHSEEKVKETPERSRLLKDRVKGLYQKLSEKYSKTSEAFYFNYFELREGNLYYRGKSTPLTTKKGELRSVGAIGETLGKERLRDLGFVIPTGKQAVMLNRVEEKLPSASDVAKADDIELQEIAKSMED